MAEIKPIETVYNGYRFRSRLEARWAVFFDEAGIPYRYEPEGFEVDLGDEIIRYLPDFYLPELDCYVEIKPSKEKLMEDQAKLAWMIDYDGPMACGLLILGQIPFLDENSITHPYFTLYRCDSGVCSYRACFVKGDKWCLVEDDRGSYDVQSAPYLAKTPVGDDLYLNSAHHPMKFDAKGCVWDLRINAETYYLIGRACKTARKARFEHGEHGR